MPKRKTSIVTVANKKGGCGKTTCVVNLASAYAISGKKVLVIDADWQANATSHIRAIEHAGEQNKYLYDAIMQESQSVNDYIVKTDYQNIDCLAADARIEDIPKIFEGKLNQFKLFNPFLRSPEINNYDIILIDTHPDFSTIVKSALVASDYYIIPMFPEEHCCQGLSTMMLSGNEVARHQNPMLTFLGCVITKFDKNCATHRDMEKSLRAQAKEGRFNVFSTMIPSSNFISAAAVKEAPIHFLRDKSGVGISYTQLAGEILPQLKGKRRGRRPALPDHSVIQDSFDNDDNLEAEVIL